MSLNVENLKRLIAHLEAQPPERINMAFGEYEDHPGCGTCGCILGHADLIWPELYELDRENDAGEHFGLADKLGLSDKQTIQLTHPPGYTRECDGVVRYPAHRVIATLKRLRDHYLATGEIVVDWGPEPTAGEPWAAPQAIELTPPALPAEITRLLAPESSALTTSEA